MHIQITDFGSAKIFRDENDKSAGGKVPWSDSMESLNDRVFWLKANITEGCQSSPFSLSVHTTIFSKTIKACLPHVYCTFTLKTGLVNVEADNC